MDKKFENGNAPEWNHQKSIWRTALHMEPPVGWLNDPNGLCELNGVYHVFFQYSPDTPLGSDKYWGHYESRDLVHWEFTGIALSPDCSFDQNGVYSGSALVEDGQMYLYYTGNVKEDGDHDYVTSGRIANTVLVTSPNGIQMSDKQLLLNNQDYPADLTCHVRDPKVWRENNNYYMIQGARNQQDVGEALLFTSSDKVNWTFHNKIVSENPFGYMWECPDLFCLEGRRILSLCPQGLVREQFRYQNQYQSGYFELTGDFTGEAGGYQLSTFREWDMGFDFYAPQTFMDSKGRRILIAWIGMIDCDEEYTNLPTIEEGWQHLLSLPRELTYRDGLIYQTPIEELKSLREEEQSYSGNASFFIEGAYELEVKKIHDNEFYYSPCRGVTIHYTPYTNVFKLQFEDKTGSGRQIRRALVNELKELRIFVDHSIIEIFVNGGEYVFTTRFYPQDPLLKNELLCGGCEVHTWKLEL